MFQHCLSHISARPIALFKFAHFVLCKLLFHWILFYIYLFHHLFFVICQSYCFSNLNLVVLPFNGYFWRCMWKHTKHQVKGLFFSNNAFVRNVYHRSLRVIFGFKFLQCHFPVYLLSISRYYNANLTFLRYQFQVSIMKDCQFHVSTMSISFFFPLLIPCKSMYLNCQLYTSNFRFL